MNLIGSKSLFSIMIPTWNPDPIYLKETIDSVLAQDTGKDRMQIAVVDDCSTNVDVHEWLQKWGFLDRIEWFQNETNRGIGGAWNACIEHSRGELIHILHQDDVVFEGFYEKVEKAYVEEGAKNIFSRTQFLKESNEIKYSPEVQKNSGILTMDIEEFTTSVIFQCPSVVIHRSVYDQVGVFDETLTYSLDREMWIRIAVRFPFYFINKVLCGYRISEDSTTSKLSSSGKQFTDSFIGVKRFTNYLPYPKNKRAYKKIAIRLSWALIDSLNKSNYSFIQYITLSLALIRFSPYKATLGYIVKGKS